MSKNVQNEYKIPEIIKLNEKENNIKIKKIMIMLFF